MNIIKLNKMKNTQKIKALEKLKKFFLIPNKKYEYPGLCGLFHFYREEFEQKERQFIIDLLHEKSKKVRVGYEYLIKSREGAYNKVTITNSNRHMCFLWKPYAVKPRINWIDKQIAELSLLTALQKLRTYYADPKLYDFGRKSLCIAISDLGLDQNSTSLLKEFINRKLKESPVEDLWYDKDTKVLSIDHYRIRSKEYWSNTKNKLGFYLFRPFDVESRLKFLDDEIAKLNSNFNF